jgi:HSP20 family protein
MGTRRQRAGAQASCNVPEVPMTALTSWNPFKHPLTRFSSSPDLDDMFRSLALRPMFRELETAPDVRIEVTEDDKAYHVKADVPGLRKEDIEISIEGNQVSIGAEVRRETDKRKDDKIIHSERYYGRVYRGFTLPMDVESSKANARYEDGVLSLTLPKKGNGHSRRIAIS